MKKHIVYFLLVCSVLFIQCKKEENNVSENEGLFSLSEGQALLRFQADALIMLNNKNWVTNAPSAYLDGDWNVHTGAAFYGYSHKTSSKCYLVKPLQVETRFATETDVHDKSKNFQSAYDLFGNEVRVGVDSLFEIDMYIPKPIEWNGPAPSQSSSINPISRSKGETIYWNKDSKNNKGVIIDISYVNPKDAGKSDQYLKTQRLVTKDIGQFTITPDLIKNIPLDFEVYIDLSRGSYKMIPKAKDNLNYLVMAQTKTSFTFKVKN